MSEDGTRGPKASIRFDRAKLKAARQAAGLTQKELAAEVELPRRAETLRPGEKACLNVATVRRAERGEPVSKEVAIAFTRRLGKPLDELLLPTRVVYYMPGGRFERQNDKWIEYHGDKEIVVFEEFDVTDNYIHLVCTRRRSENGHRMLVRIPTKGGQIEWTYENPLVWEPFNIVKIGEFKP